MCNHCELAGPNVGWRALLRPADDPGVLVVYKAGFIKEVCCLTAGVRKGPAYLEWIVRREPALHACFVSWREHCVNKHFQR